MLGAAVARPRWPAPSRVVILHLHRRLLSTIPTQSNHTPSQPPPPPPTPRQLPRLDLRPAPVKPSTLSATHTPTKPSHPLPRPAAVSPQSLNVVKAQAIRDVEDAEAHGVLAPPPPNANWFRRTLHKGIELAKFYYRGVKLINTRRKDIKLIRARIKQGGLPLSRAENRLIRTQKEDIVKIVPFLFIALLLEEVIPLIAIYAPFMLPSTCVLPSQRQRIEEKRTEKALAFAQEYRQLFSQLKRRQNPSGHLPLDTLRGNDASTAVCGIFRLSTTGFEALRIRRIMNHLQFIAVDDQLILQDNLLGNLPERMLQKALQERGIITQGLSSNAMEIRMKWWLDSVGQSSSEARRLHLTISRL